MLLLCVIALLAVLVVLGFPSRRQPTEPNADGESTMSSNFTSIAPSSQESSAIIAAASAQEEDLYIVKEYKGHIGVFRDGEDLPFEEINIDVNIFPQADQDLLKKGIQAHGTAELTSIIEDYEG